MNKIGPISTRIQIGLVILLLYAAPNFGSAQDRKEDSSGEDTISIGMSTALTGPAADLGRNVKDGVLAAFQEANEKGGIRGQKLTLKALDDGYEPSRTAPNMRTLIEKDNVVAIIGNVGTPTAIAAIPIANSTRTPFFGAYTGAGALRKTPPDRYIINYRASYAEETASMVDALIKHAGIAPNEIAFFTQRDGYGDAGFNGGMEALKQQGLTDDGQIAHGRYERNTTCVERGLAELLLHPVAPKAVIMVGAYRPCSKFIKLAKASGYEPLFLNVSFVGSKPLASALGPDGDGVIITQVVPHPESKSTLARKYRAALAKNSSKSPPSHGSFEGYIAARILIKAIAAMDGTPTREGIVDQLEQLGHFNLDSILNLELSQKNHQANHTVWPTVLSNGDVIPFSWNKLPSLETGNSQ